MLFLGKLNTKTVLDDGAERFDTPAELTKKQYSKNHGHITAENIEIAPITQKSR